MCLVAGCRVWDATQRVPEGAAPTPPVHAGPRRSVLDHLLVAVVGPRLVLRASRILRSASPADLDGTGEPRSSRPEPR